ncbi:MAG: CBS domain-containing protein [Candidatus Diapherotrites archaeon]
MQVSKLTAQDALSSDFETISEFESVSAALYKARKSHAVIVVDSGNNVKGVLSEKAIVRANADLFQTKAGSLALRVSRVSPSQSLGETAKLLLENEVPFLPVLEGNEILGVVSHQSVLKQLLKSDFAKSAVQEAASKNIVSISESDSIGKAFSLMRAHNFSHLPVQNAKGNISGIVAMHDLVTKVLQSKQRIGRKSLTPEKVKQFSSSVKSIYSTDLQTVSPSSSLKSAIDKMLDADVASLLVLDSKNQVSGILTRKDILQLLASQSVSPSEIVFSYAKGGEIQHIDPFDLSDMKEQIVRFAQKYPSIYKKANFFAYIKKQKETFRQAHLYNVRLRIQCAHGLMTSQGSAYGISFAVHDALKNLERQAEKQKGTHQDWLFSLKQDADSADLY